MTARSRHPYFFSQSLKISLWVQNLSGFKSTSWTRQQHRYILCKTPIHFHCDLSHQITLTWKPLKAFFIWSMTQKQRYPLQGSDSLALWSVPSHLGSKSSLASIQDFSPNWSLPSQLLQSPPITKDPTSHICPWSVKSITEIYLFYSNFRLDQFDALRKIPKLTFTPLTTIYTNINIIQSFNLPMQCSGSILWKSDSSHCSHWKTQIMFRRFSPPGLTL